MINFVQQAKMSFLVAKWKKYQWSLVMWMERKCCMLIKRICVNSTSSQGNLQSSGTYLFLVDLHDGILSTHDTILVTWHYNLILVEDWGRNVYFGTCLFSQFVDQGVVWSTDEWVVDVGNLQSLKGKFGL